MSKRILFYFILICLYFVPHKAHSQTLKRHDIPFQSTNSQLKMPLAGGLNDPQFSPVDFNNDGKSDVFTFDRIGNVRLAFLRDNTGFAYTPQYLNTFPELNDWALLRDFNGDGIADIFTYNDGAVSGIRIFKGKIQNGQIAFDRMNFASNGNVLSYPLSNGTRTNLYVNSVDIPAIDDIDGDGDLDILAFEVGGGKVYWYKNLSRERNFGRDSLIFDVVDNCWGRFLDNGFQPSVKLGTQTDCATGLRGGNDISVVARHPGASLTTFDKDGDGDKDLLIGSVSFENLTELTNSGTVQQAWMSAQDNSFPKNSEAVNLPVFPSAYFIDVDNDGKRDILVSPNSTNFIENYNVVWYYKNTGTAQVPAFQLQQKNYLVNDMLDLGAGANPAFIDYDADGLLDIVMGNYSYFKSNNERESRLFLYRNIGTSATPQYKLIDDNWLNFKVLTNIDVVNFSPTFGDIDGDGDLDLLVGEDSGSLIFVENRGGANRPLSMGAPQVNWKGLQLGSSCKPHLVDLNRDGLLDIVNGSRNGNLRYFQNTGTKTQAVFNTTPTNTFLGRVDVRDLGFATGFTAPVFVDFKGKYLLFVGSENGKIQVYDNIDNNLNGTFRLVDADYGKVREGTRTTVAIANFVAPNGDTKLDMLVGNYRGGIGAFQMTYNIDGTTPIQNIDNEYFVQLYPNPSADYITVDIQNTPTGFSKMSLRVVNVLGQIVKTVEAQTPQYSMPISDLQQGIYFMEILIGEKRQVMKFRKMN
jgi:hypothetical protein